MRELLAESTGRAASSIAVQAVVLYPGWNVEPNSSGRAVWILNPKALISFLDYQDTRLSSEDIALFSSRLSMQNLGATGTGDT